MVKVPRRWENRKPGAIPEFVHDHYRDKAGNADQKDRVVAELLSRHGPAVDALVQRFKSNRPERAFALRLLGDAGVTAAARQAVERAILASPNACGVRSRLVNAVTGALANASRRNEFFGSKADARQSLSRMQSFDACQQILSRSGVTPQAIHRALRTNRNLTSAQKRELRWLVRGMPLPVSGGSQLSFTDLPPDQAVRETFASLEPVSMARRGYELQPVAGTRQNRFGVRQRALRQVEQQTTQRERKKRVRAFQCSADPARWSPARGRPHGVLRRGRVGATRGENP